MTEIIEPLETASITAARFLALAEDQDIDWRITWFWSARNRHGRLTLRDAEGKALFIREYERNTALWTGSDSYLKKGMRTGSPRHLAVLDALAFLQSL